MASGSYRQLPEASPSQRVTRVEIIVVGGIYRLLRKIGAGSFGTIYLGVNMTDGEEVAVKMESITTKHPQLMYESKVYKILEGGIGIPNTKWCGLTKSYNVLVMDLLGPNLEQLFVANNRIFSIKTILQIAIQAKTGWFPFPTE